IAALGIATFLGLHRSASAPTMAEGALPISTRAPSTSATLPPPPVLAPIAPTAPIYVIPPAAPMPAPARSLVVPVQSPPRQTTPALVVDLTPGERPAVVAGPLAATGTVPGRASANDAFASRVNGTAVETVTADKLSSIDLVVPQGTVIAGVLETAINSDLPGQVRAVVSRDVPGFDGTKVLIPRGSRLIGQYSSGVALGQSRAFVIWSRVLRSDGVSIQLGSAGTDELGTAGLGGKVNNHFLRRFGAATLLSVITAGLEYAGSRSSGSTVVVGSSSQANQLATVALQRDIDIPPTIKVAQGTPIRVFVAKDLDFGPAPGSMPGSALGSAPGGASGSELPGSASGSQPGSVAGKRL
ncbi:MAG: type IV secretion system protein VirB10, partial [Janthinobacterium lividum]